MTDSKRISQFINDIENLEVADQTLNKLIIKLREKQLNYRECIIRLSSWRAGKGADQANQHAEFLFFELSKRIQQLENSQLEVGKVRKQLDVHLRSEIVSGPKW